MMKNRLCKKCGVEIEKYKILCFKCLEENKKNSSKKWRENNKEKCKEYNKINTKKYRLKNLDKCRKMSINSRVKKRKEALIIVGKGKLECINCGCNDIRILEINHKNLNGSKEYKSLKSPSQFIYDIISGKRKTDDLELRCSVCNILHYIEKKYNIKQFKIGWI